MRKILVISILLTFGNSIAHGDILQDSKVWKFFGKIANDAKSNFPELPFLNKELEEGILKFGSATYIGTIKSGKAHGEGVFMFPDGTKYEGGWRDGMMKGQGTYTHPNGSKYIGEHKDNQPNGRGTMTYPDGEKCIGEWENVAFPNGECYDKNGNIQYRYENGKRIRQ